MPKDNCDSRVHLMLVAHADSLGFLSNLRVGFVIQNYFGIIPCHQVSTGLLTRWQVDQFVASSKVKMDVQVSSPHGLCLYLN